MPRVFIGANLSYKAKISLVDALLGFERKLTLLDGTRVPIVHDQVTGDPAAVGRGLVEKLTAVCRTLFV